MKALVLRPRLFNLYPFVDCRWLESNEVEHGTHSVSDPISITFFNFGYSEVGGEVCFCSQNMLLCLKMRNASKLCEIPISTIPTAVETIGHF